MLAGVTLNYLEVTVKVSSRSQNDEKITVGRIGIEKYSKLPWGKVQFWVEKKGIWINCKCFSSTKYFD